MIELFIISNLKLPYKVIMTNTVENRYIHQWNIIETAKINPHGYCHPFFNKGIKTHSVKNKVASSNWCSGNWLSTCSVQNNESRPLSPILHKNQLKNNLRPESKALRQLKGKQSKQAWARTPRRIPAAKETRADK